MRFSYGQQYTNKMAADNQCGRKSFRWSDEMIENLVKSLVDYKTQMTYRGLDFDGDKPLLYTEVRKRMAAIYEADNINLFGTVESNSLNPKEVEFLSDEDVKKMKNDIKVHNQAIIRGRNRVQEKIKEIRQNFSKALINGTRSGSGKVVFSHYETLKEIWGSSANVEALSFGIDTENTAAISTSTSEEDSFVDECTTRNSYQLEPAIPTVDETDTPVGDTTDNDVNSRKRKSSIPALVHLRCKSVETMAYIVTHKQ